MMTMRSRRKRRRSECEFGAGMEKEGGRFDGMIYRERERDGNLFCFMFFFLFSREREGG
ncbi:hypothetical protein OIU78_001356, partial [Salix suchowensis]